MIRRKLVRFFLLPLLGYALGYIVLTFPLILRFNSAYFCDSSDGLQMIWNIWWVRYALVDLHQGIYFTHMLHQPNGAGLWLHSFVPIDGLLGVPLSIALTQVQVYNTIIVFVFASAGLTAFWLAYDQTRRYWPSLAGGYAFTFSSIHFAHAAGHLHQITTFCFPLYVLLFLRLLRKPTLLNAIGAALALLGVLLSDHYQFAYAGLLSILLGLLNVQRRVTAATLRAGLVFAGIALVLCGPLVWQMRQAAREPLLGVHPPEILSADVLNLVVPGVTWQYSDLTWGVWEPMGQYAEKDVAVALAILIAAMFARRRRSFSPATWWIAAAIFTLLALGPLLHIDNHVVLHTMPYQLLNRLPGFDLSGCPARMMMVTHLCLSVLAAAGLARLGTLRVVIHQPRRLVVALLFISALVIETQPRVQATVAATAPAWVFALRDLPIKGSIIETRTSEEAPQLYFQTLHRRPMAFGYLSRIPQSLARSDERIHQLLARGDYRELAHSGFGCLVLRATDLPVPLPVMYEDKEVRIYRLPDADSGSTANPRVD